VADRDLLRAERLARQLHRDFSDSEAFDVSYVEDEVSAADGVKGETTAIVLSIVTGWGWPVAAPLLAELIKSALHRERHSTVRVTVGADFVEIAGEPTEEQQKLLLALLSGGAKR
jgi:hypothetical protein